MHKTKQNKTSSSWSTNEHLWRDFRHLFRHRSSFSDAGQPRTLKCLQKTPRAHALHLDSTGWEWQGGRMNKQNVDDKSHHLSIRHVAGESLSPH